jgi:GT2 family glycosyltransferase
MHLLLEDDVNLNPDFVQRLSQRIPMIPASATFAPNCIADSYSHQLPANWCGEASISVENDWFHHSTSKLLQIDPKNLATAGGANFASGTDGGD